MRFKKKNLEIRQFEDRIVCVEYEVFNAEDDSEPIQIMRSFFSVANECYKHGVKGKKKLKIVIIIFIYTCHVLGRGLLLQ